MHRKLDDFIEDNRRAFDDEVPAGRVWDEIETNIKRAQHRSRFYSRRWMVAASIALIIAASGGWWLWQKSTSDKTEKMASQPPAIQPDRDMAALAPEFAAYARKVSAMIGERREQLKAETAKQPELYEQFTQDLSALDSAYRVLHNQALQTPNREVIIRAMMQNLQLQAELLNKQLQILTAFPIKKNREI